MATGNSAMDTLKGILGNDADKKIQAVMESLSGSTSAPEPPQAAPERSAQKVNNALASLGDDASLDYLLRIKGIIDELGSSRDDPRSNLLMSLKPYMRGSRQKSIDSAVKMLNLTKLSGLFKLK